MPARLPHCHPTPWALGLLPAGQHSPTAPVCPGASNTWINGSTPPLHHLLICGGKPQRGSDINFLPLTLLSPTSDKPSLCPLSQVWCTYELARFQIATLDKLSDFLSYFLLLLKLAIRNVNLNSALIHLYVIFFLPVWKELLLNPSERINITVTSTCIIKQSNIHVYIIGRKFTWEFFLLHASDHWWIVPLVTPSRFFLLRLPFFAFDFRRFTRKNFSSSDAMSYLTHV